MSPNNKIPLHWEVSGLYFRGKEPKSERPND